MQAIVQLAPNQSPPPLPLHKSAAPQAGGVDPPATPRRPALPAGLRFFSRHPPRQGQAPPRRHFLK